MLPETVDPGLLLTRNFVLLVIETTVSNLRFPPLSAHCITSFTATSVLKSVLLPSTTVDVAPTEIVPVKFAPNPFAAVVAPFPASNQ